MDETGFRKWYEARQIAAASIATRLSMVRLVERHLADLDVPYRDLDAGFTHDQLAAAIEAVRGLRRDAASGGTRFRLLMPESGRPLGRLANAASWVRQYRDYRMGRGAHESDADRIRRHALEDYIVPTREAGNALVTIGIRAVNEALGLNQGWPNIQQALTGPTFLEMAEVDRPMRKGPRQSTTTTFTYYLDGPKLLAPIAYTVLGIEFGAPITDTQKIFGVQAPDGRQIALQRGSTRLPLIWVEVGPGLPQDLEVKRIYGPHETRHSGLPPRLRHGGPQSRQVALCPAPTWESFLRIVEHHTETAAGPATVEHVLVQSGAAVSQPPEPTNLILYGPPGTGKTYATAAEAVRLCSPGVDLNDREAVMAEYGRLFDARRIEFVTFHQSFSYEDFVEGLRPPVSADDNERSGFSLEVSPGVFHQIATRASASKGSSGKTFDFTGRQIFKMSIGEAANPGDAYLFDEAIADGYTLIGFGNIDWADDRFSSRDAMIEARKIHEPDAEPPTPQTARVQCMDMFRNWIRPGDLLIVTKGNGRFRAIGEVEGPYEYAPRERDGYFHRRKVKWLWHDVNGVPVEEIYAKRFSMRTLYMLASSELNISALERYITSQEPGGPPEQFVLIIDEINRANISKVFGELITLLEPDKRTTPEGGVMRLRLPYSKDLFGVPNNLHVIGTMNTADRSIALLDTALRRRFEFRELMPDPDLKELKLASDRCGVDLGKLLRTLNDRIEYLFDREHQIGHAYFIRCASKADVDAVMRNKVIPLLAEYFYEDWSKVALVLGDADGTGRFLSRVQLKAPGGLEGDHGGERYRWALQTEFAPDIYAAFK